MAKKKRAARKTAKNSTERVRAHRERQGSKVQVNVTLPRAAVTRLDKLCKSSSQSRAVVIESLIVKGAPAKKAKATKKKAVKGGECRLCFQWRPDAELDHLHRGKERYMYVQCKDFSACAKKRGIVK